MRSLTLGALCALASCANAQICSQLVGSGSGNYTDAADGFVYGAIGSVVAVFDLNGGIQGTSSAVAIINPPGINHNRVIISGTLAFIDSSSGVSLYDVTDPTSPVLLEELDFLYSIKDFERGPDGTIFASAQAIEIDPLVPSFGGVVAFTPTGEFIAYEQYDADASHGMEATETVVYQTRSQGGLFAIPFNGGFFGTPTLMPGMAGARDVAVEGDYIYVAKGFSNECPRRGFAIFTGAGTTVLTEVGFVSLPHNAQWIDVFGDYLLVTRPGHPTRLYSIADPENPALLDTLNDGRHAQWIDGLAFSGAHWYDVTDCTPPCPADFDGDNDVDLGDFGIFGAAFGSVTGDANYDAAADFDDDGDVDLGDFGLFGGQFGRTDC